MAESGSSSIDIEAGVEEVFAIVADLEAYPDWVDGMKSVELHEVDEDGLPVRCTQLVDAGIKTIEYTLVYECDHPHRMTWRSEPGGDVKLIEGAYTFAVNDDGTTKVTYDLTIDPGFRVPGFMVRQATKRIIGTALDGLKARAEA